jgi:tight adherence protein B
VNPVYVAVVFLVLFATALVAVSVGWRFSEAQRKKEVEGLLQVASGRESGATQTSILAEKSDVDPVTYLWRDPESIQRLTRFIQQSGLNWTVNRLVATMVIGGIVGAILGFWLHPLGFVTLSVIVGALLGGWLPALFLRWKRSKRLSEFEQQLPEALDFMARSMKAGHGFSTSLETLGSESPDPLGQEFRALFNELNLGAPLDTALANFSLRVPLLDVRLFASSVLLQRQTGGNLSEILTRLAYVIRERFRLRGQVKAASAHGRMTALVLTLLPVVLVVGLTIIAPDYLQLMVNDPDGKYIILGAVAAQVLGYYFMRRITDIKV